MGPEKAGFVPALASCDDNEECAMEIVGHVDVSAVEVTDLIQDPRAVYTLDDVNMVTILAIVSNTSLVTEYLGAAVKSHIFSALRDRCKRQREAGDSPAGLRVERGSLVVKITGAPRNLAIAAQDALWLYPMHREALVSLLRLLIPGLSGALTPTSAATAAAVKPNPLDTAGVLRLERSFVRSQTACFEQVASCFASIWVVEMSPHFVHEMQPSASSEQSDIEPEGMACLQLARELQPVGPGLILGIGGTRNNWKPGFRALKLTRRWAHVLLLREMPRVFEEDPSSTLLRLRSGQPPRICYFAEDEASFSSNVKRINAHIVSIEGVSVLGSSRLSFHS